LDVLDADDGAAAIHFACTQPKSSRIIQIRTMGRGSDLGDRFASGYAVVPASVADVDRNNVSFAERK
jgi:hypothetical protein